MHDFCPKISEQIIGRFSNGGEERISGVDKLVNGDGEEELKRQSIDKVNLTREKIYLQFCDHYNFFSFRLTTYLQCWKERGATVQVPKTKLTEASVLMRWNA